MRLLRPLLNNWHQRAECYSCIIANFLNYATEFRRKLFPKPIDNDNRCRIGFPERHILSLKKNLLCLQ